MRFARNYWPQKGNCFVIMPFGKKTLRNEREFDWDTHYGEVIKPTVEQAGMTAIRADEIFGSQTLMDRIWRGIQEAEVVIADLTGRSPNVFYEVGLAHVIGKRILILTMYPEDVPVDLSEFVQIRYATEGIQLLQLTRELTRNLLAARNEPTVEAMISPLVGGEVEPISAIVLSTTPDFAIVEAKDGRRGFLNADDFSWTRRRIDLTRLVKVDQELNGAFVVDTKGQPRYSLTAVQENPWPRLENEFPIGRSFSSTVRTRVSRIGAFVPLRYGIDGLIPENQIPQSHSLEAGTEVEVVPVRVDTQQREVELRLVRARDGGTTWGPYRVGQVLQGTIARIVYERGFLLVKLENNDTGLMPVAKMSRAFWERFNDRMFEEGEPVQVEITAVDPQNHRLTLCDALVE